MVTILNALNFVLVKASNVCFMRNLFETHRSCSQTREVLKKLINITRKNHVIMGHCYQVQGLNRMQLILIENSKKKTPTYLAFAEKPQFKSA